MMPSIINYAHRGASGYRPENTMSAFEHALAIGATGIETDVQMTRDGKLVLIHDESLKRTTGRDALVAEVDYSELQQLDAGSWYAPEYSTERVPSLEQLLELTKNTDTIINIELKNGIILYSGMEQKVIDTVRAFDRSDRIIISSFNHYSLAECHQLAPDIATGILYMEGLYRPWDYAQTIGASYLHPHHYAAIAEWVTEAAQQGKHYNPFTVNEEKEMSRLIAMGVAGIITDYPDRLAALL